MSKTLWVIGIVFIVLVAGAMFVSQDSAPIGASVQIGQALTGDTTGYTRAVAPKPIRFPEDHGPHPDYKLEWWYYTGNLSTESGRRFGYQFTIFRNALAPPDSTAIDIESSWSTKQLYFAHFAVSDIENKAFYASERFSRGAAGLAGAQADPFKVWLEDWQAEQTSEGMPPMRVQATQDGAAIDLTMDLAKPIVFQGDNGYSVKGPGYGNASYYYSMTRLKTSGTVTIDGEAYPVEGASWMDREWSTSLLAEDQEGWDWFSIQLNDGRDLMYFNVRHASGDVTPYSDGALFAQDGSKRELKSTELQLDVLDTWESPKGGVYPSRWRMRVPSEELDLNIEPFFNNQELDVAVRYWEGAVKVSGTAGNQPISGVGYVELTGYDPSVPLFTD